MATRIMSKSNFIWLIVLAVTLVSVTAACDTGSTPNASTGGGAATNIMVPVEFEVVKYFGGLDHPTSMAIGPNGRLYVTLLNGDVISLTDENNDGLADSQRRLITEHPVG